MLATVVEGKELLQTVVFSAVAGLGVTFAFSVAIWGVGRFGELNRSERPLAAGGAALVAALGLTFVAAAIVFGVVVMLSK